MPKEQQKYALSILRTLKKRNEASPFLQPVDPVALGIPTYPQIVTRPMDLSTAERKTQQGQYRNVDEFKADVRQIWENCYKFNGHESPISIWAKTLGGVFEKQIQKMPTLQSVSHSFPPHLASPPLLICVCSACLGYAAHNT
jgi:bromodomain-containing factor 1